MGTSEAEKHPSETGLGTKVEVIRKVCPVRGLLRGRTDERELDDHLSRRDERVERHLDGRILDWEQPRSEDAGESRSGARINDRGERLHGAGGRVWEGKREKKTAFRLRHPRFCAFLISSFVSPDRRLTCDGDRDGASGSSFVGVINADVVLEVCS
jgi:hypothetical protein